MIFLAPFRHLARRPALLVAAVVAAAAWWLSRSITEPASATLIGWCAGVVVYLIATVWNAARSSAKRVRERAAELDEGGGAVLCFTIAAAVASVVAIVMNLAKAKGSANATSAAALAVVTILLSWAFIQAVFAFHYAHEFYRRSADKIEKGLHFPETPEPDYWDFLYFSFVIGMTAQVADVITESTKMRRLVLAHSIVAFFFNTAILALGVNLAANLAE